MPAFHVLHFSRGAILMMDRADLVQVETNNCGWKRLCDPAGFKRDCGDGRDS